MKAKKIGKRIFGVAILLLMMGLVLGTAALAANDDGRSSYSQLVNSEGGLTIVKNAEGDVPDYARYFEFEITYIVEDRWGSNEHQISVIVDSQDPNGTTVSLEGMDSIVSIKEVTGAPDGFKVTSAYSLSRQWQDWEPLSFSPVEEGQLIRTRSTTINLASDTITVSLSVAHDEGGNPIYDEEKDEHIYHFTVSGPGGYSKDVTLTKNHREESLTNLAPGEYTFTADTIGGMVCAEGSSGNKIDWQDECSGFNVNAEHGSIKICKIGKANTEYFFSISSYDSAYDLSPCAEGIKVFNATNNIGEDNTEYSEVTNFTGWDNYFVIQTNAEGKGEIKIEFSNEVITKIHEHGSGGTSVNIGQIDVGFYNAEIALISTTTNDKFNPEEGYSPDDVKGGTLTVTNTYEKTEPMLGTLTVSKEVTGGGANPNDTFSFKVTLYRDGEVWDYNTGKDTNIPWTEHRAAFKNGVVYIDLKDGESHSIINLPIEVDGEKITYTVEEVDSKGYTTTVPGNAEGEVKAGQTKVEFVNHKEPDNPPPPPPPSVYYGTYKYIHEYYYKDADGNLTLEGTSPMATSGRVELPDDTRYTEADVARVYEYQDHTYKYDSDAYGTVSAGRYSEVGSMTYVNATTAGNQIIILKYVRTDEPATGGYKVVHEYYFRDADGAETLEGRSGISAVDELPLDDTRYTEEGVEREPVFGKHRYTYESAAYGGMTGETEYAADGGMTSVVTTEDGVQIIILKYVRTVDPEDPENPDMGVYQIVHEYYLRTAEGDRFEGRSELSQVGDLPLDETQYTESGVERVYIHRRHNYTYDSAAYGIVSEDGYVADSDMTCVVATVDGVQVIILRYIRILPPELPDPNDPESPEEVTIEEDDVPKTYLKVWDPEEEEWEYIPEEDVPLWGFEIPETGDSMGLWALLAAGSLGGLCVLCAVRPKRREDDA